MHGSMGLKGFRMNRKRFMSAVMFCWQKRLAFITMSAMSVPSSRYDLIRLAKQIGVKVTAEVCPHHLLLSDEDIPGLDDANWKMNPPLRSPRDVQAVIEGLEDGTLDMIVTDHAPHSAEEKAHGVQLAPFGIVGFETAFPLLYTKFVRTGKWTLGFLLQRMTVDPARVFGLSSGHLMLAHQRISQLWIWSRNVKCDPRHLLQKGQIHHLAVGSYMAGQC